MAVKIIMESHNDSWVLEERRGETRRGNGVEKWVCIACKRKKEKGGDTNWPQQPAVELLVEWGWSQWSNG